MFSKNEDVLLYETAIYGPTLEVNLNHVVSSNPLFIFYQLFSAAKTTFCLFVCFSGLGFIQDYKLHLLL